MIRFTRKSMCYYGCLKERNDLLDVFVCVCCARWEKVGGEKVEGGRGDENGTDKILGRQ